MALDKEDEEFLDFLEDLEWEEEDTQRGDGKPGCLSIGCAGVCVFMLIFAAFYVVIGTVILPAADNQALWWISLGCAIVFVSFRLLKKGNTRRN